MEAEAPSLSESSAPPPAPAAPPLVDLASQDVGPDPVLGAGLAITGMLVMGLAGGLDAHYPFLVGALIAVAGAVTFVGCVALSTWKRRRLERAQLRARVPAQGAQA